MVSSFKMLLNKSVVTLLKIAKIMTNLTIDNQTNLTKCTWVEKNIGYLIFERLTQTEHSITWFARKLHCSRTNVYNIFKKTNLDVELLKRISVILNYNFFEGISAETRSIILENQREWLVCDSSNTKETEEPSA